ncbi:MAG: PAS domain S-box protein, partial [Dissulfurispiraceae bacterium]
TIGQHLEAVNRGLQLVREELPEWRAFGWREVNHRLKALDDAMPGIRTIYITDALGTVLATDRAGLSGKNFSSREYFYVPRRQPDPKTLYISPPFKTSETRIIGMNVTLIISGPHGEFNGIITATLDPLYFSNILSSVLYAPDMWSSIVHGDGLQFLMIPQREDEAGINRAAPGSFITRHMQSGKPENVFTGIYFATGEKPMMALSTVNPGRVKINKPLIVTVSRGIDSIYYDWRRAVKMQSALFGLMCISGIIGLYFYQRRQEIFYRSEEDSIIALRDSELRYRRIVDTANEGIWVIGEDTMTTFVNERMADMLGYSAEEMIGQSVIAFMFDEDAADHHRRMESRFQGVSDFSERRFRRKDGQTVWTLAAATSILDDDHHFKGSFAMFTDITERKKAEEALLYFQMAVDSATDAIGMSTPEGRHYYQNEAFTNLFGLSVSEVDGVSGPPSTVYADEKEGAKIFRTIMKGGFFAGEVKMLDKDRNEKDIYLRAYSIKSKDGKVVGLVGIHTDTTDRKKAEEKLRKREWQLSESQRVAHLGSWDLNLISQELEWSNETYRLFDRSPEDFVPSFNEFARLVHPDDHATMETNFFKALESDANPYHVDVRIINDSGREWVMEAFGVVRRDSSGKALSIFGTAQDITERKMAEEQVQQSLREKETLLRELYHRTKNNMQVIISLLNLQSGGIDDKKTLQILEDTKNRIQSMALVHEKLYKAKNLSQVYLSDYINDLADALMKSHDADNGQISLQVDVARIPVSIDTITPLGLVINELMTNALKYAFPDNKKGEIIIKALKNEDGIIELAFSDNGIGIPKSIDLTKAESLGLKIVRALVELQIKGKLEIKTQNRNVFIIRFRDKGIPAGI